MQTARVTRIGEQSSSQTLRPHVHTRARACTRTRRRSSRTVSCAAYAYPSPTPSNIRTGTGLTPCHIRTGTGQGGNDRYDRVVFACPASAAANVLEGKSRLEATLLRAIR